MDEMMRKQKRKEQGITLIALVVTIVVLLILAAVSISMLTGENGIITQAQNSKEESEIGEEKEEISLAYSGAIGKKQNTNITAGDMQDQFDYNGTKAQASGNINIQFTESKRWYKIVGGEIEGPYEGEPQKTLVDMFKQAQADNCNLTCETCTNSNHLHIGDYLDYNPIEGKNTTVYQTETGVDMEQKYVVDTNTTWRILGLNEAGTEIIMISGSPIKREGDLDDPYLHLCGAESYVYCEETLDKICNIYENDYASEARSIRIEDINQALGVVKEGNIVYKKGDTSKTNIDKWGVLGRTYTYQEGDYSPESYLGLESITPGVTTVTADAYYYDYENPNLIDQDSVLWNVLFDGTTYEKGYAKSYWLASPGVRVYEYGAYFESGLVGVGNAGTGLNLFNSDGSMTEYYYAVRPVVSLKSNITEQEVPITTGSEVDWATSPGGGTS